ncbi:hypothetical protein [Mycoplasma sp. SG1]|uniref:hypothetical protein n=1 Tax=Mycoplasma sp. SG1 TaxID=2810348 RepID=UPI0020243A0F|nr:hypothetical protein [Mycoplasma sp. SG1]URM53072.1 hypothetical protein JRW51_01860 [Mycoplasma sp. SG1]
MQKLYLKILVFCTLVIFLIVSFATYIIFFFNGVAGNGGGFPDSQVPNVEKANKQFVKQSQDYYKNNIESKWIFNSEIKNDSFYEKYLQNGVDTGTMINDFIKHSFSPKLFEWYLWYYASDIYQIPIINHHFSFSSSEHLLTKPNRLQLLATSTDDQTKFNNTFFTNKWSLSDLVWSYIDVIDSTYNKFPSLNKFIREAIQPLLDKLQKKFDTITFIPQSIKKELNPYFQLPKLDSLIQDLWINGLGGTEGSGSDHPWNITKLPNYEKHKQAGDYKMDYSITVGFNNLIESVSEPTGEVLSNNIVSAIGNFINDTLWSTQPNKTLKVKDLINLPIPTNFGLQIWDDTGTQFPTGITISSILINTMLRDYLQLSYSYDYDAKKDVISNGHWGIIFEV